MDGNVRVNIFNSNPHALSIVVQEDVSYESTYLSDFVMTFQGEELVEGAVPSSLLVLTNGPVLNLSFSHGRESAYEPMQGAGYEGPTVEVYGVHCSPKMFRTFDAQGVATEYRVDNCCIEVDGEWYGHFWVSQGTL